MASKFSGDVSLFLDDVVVGEFCNLGLICDLPLLMGDPSMDAVDIGGDTIDGGGN